MKNNPVTCCSEDASGPIAYHGSANNGMAGTVPWEEDMGKQAKIVSDETLVNGVAHDFNNILYVIKGFAELVLEVVQEDAKTHRHMRMILDAVDRGSRLVSHMLTLSRQTEAERYPIDIIPVVEETLRFVRGSVPENVCVHLTLSEDMRPVLANPTEIHQLLMNLCSNAAHAMHDSGGVLHVALGRVEVDSRDTAYDSGLQSGPYLRLTVSDTGTGMEQEIAERIFEPYFTTKKKGQGTGLGLCVVQRIVQGHGGAITVESAKGKGTTCQAFLPTFECASRSCPQRGLSRCDLTRKDLGEPVETGDTLPLRAFVHNIRGDIDQLEKELEHYEVEVAAILHDLQNHVRELDAHLRDLIGQDTTRPKAHDLSGKIPMEGAFQG